MVVGEGEEGGGKHKIRGHNPGVKSVHGWNRAKEKRVTTKEEGIITLRTGTRT